MTAKRDDRGADETAPATDDREPETPSTAPKDRPATRSKILTEHSATDGAARKVLVSNPFTDTQPAAPPPTWGGLIVDDPNDALLRRPPLIEPGQELVTPEQRSRLTTTERAELRSMESRGIAALPVTTRHGLRWRRPQWLAGGDDGSPAPVFTPGRG